MDGVIVDSEMLYLNLRWQFARGENPEVTLEELYPSGGPPSGRQLVPMAEAVHNGMTWQELLAEYRKTTWYAPMPRLILPVCVRREIPGCWRV